MNKDKFYYKDGSITHSLRGRHDAWVQAQLSQPQSVPLHRVDGPAAEYSNGDKEWFIDGRLHREDGPAVELINGDKKWYVNGQCHRLDGPAATYQFGMKQWIVNGKLHRVGGPASEFKDGTFCHYLDGKSYSKEAYDKMIEEVTNLPLALRLTDSREWVRSIVDQRCDGCFSCIEPCGRTKISGGS